MANNQATKVLGESGVGFANSAEKAESTALQARSNLRTLRAPGAAHAKTRAHRNSSDRANKLEAVMKLRRETSLGYQTNLLARLFEHALREAIAPHGVVPGQFPVLLSLYEHDGLTQAELCRQVRIEQPTMAKTLQRMERDGLIRRAPDPHDRRRIRIHLTTRARRLEKPLAAAGHHVIATAVHGLTPAQAATLLTTISHLIANLEHSTDAQESPPHSPRASPALHRAALR